MVTLLIKKPPDSGGFFIGTIVDPEGDCFNYCILIALCDKLTDALYEE
jgi:hypothetical protein